ncbi:MAG: L-serine ammonia-lyase, iron-sulfur-dependent, subunit alpha [Clostridia bacterium]|nr:L-serine ammonia-lyase, iron-sulfur-dependent, subunit alpha [Clostridia bacterium]MBQ5487668.1 L-serine ammonia-lyase, iron-sulfur-dependent, subunit alpha [Clostridia bacterium]
MKYGFSSGKELLSICEAEGITIAEVMLRKEIETSERSRDDLVNEMFENLMTMQEAIREGFYNKQHTMTGLADDNAEKLLDYADKANMGPDMTKICAAAIAVAEVNASMGKIVAAPTAGSSGVIPAVLVMCSEKHSFTDRDLVNGLFAAGAVGAIIAKNASIAGAEGGCQAEIGTASAMAAAALAELCGASPAMALSAAAMALKNILGLVCDPVAGLVECPCIKRNAMGAANAVLCADMALAGITSIIPFDEVVSAMRSVGRMMNVDLKETSKGGLAATPTALEIAERIHME